MQRAARSVLLSDIVELHPIPEPMVGEVEEFGVTVEDGMPLDGCERSPCDISVSVASMPSGIGKEQGRL